MNHPCTVQGPLGSKFRWSGPKFPNIRSYKPVMGRLVSVPESLHRTSDPRTAIPGDRSVITRIVLVLVRFNCVRGLKTFAGPMDHRSLDRTGLTSQ